MNRLHLPKGFKDPIQLEKRLKTEPEQKWIQRGERRALRLFHEMSVRVPAYKDFLRSKKFNPKHVASIRDFPKIPAVDKDNYLRKYTHEMLCWDGNFFDNQWVVSTTSGSTGEPYYFPRTKSQDWQYAIHAELYLRSNFHIQDQNVLYIVAFPMGAWIGGLFTYEALKIVAERTGHNLSIITPGIHKQEVINAVKQLGDKFDRIIIGAYAPFLKDILDDGIRAGINWNRYNLGFIFSAEAFSEKFRDYVIKIAGLKDEYRDTLSHYGTVDLGTMAHETPLSVLVRRDLFSSKYLVPTIVFPENKRQPTLCQYIPELFYFEEEDQNLLCSAYSGIPLLRYDLKDYGGVITFDVMSKRFEDSGYNVRKRITDTKIKNSIWNLPFVYIYERNDFSVSYYAFLLYPDTIRRALLDDSIAAIVTGKFTMFADYTKAGRQILQIYIELKHGRKPNKVLADKIQLMLHQVFIKESSEYREVFSMMGEIVKPHIRLRQYEDPEFFKAGTKQKWVAKEK